jgi:hypothetical protein
MLRGLKNSILRFYKKMEIKKKNDKTGKSRDQQELHRCVYSCRPGHPSMRELWGMSSEMPCNENECKED